MRKYEHFEIFKIEDMTIKLGFYHDGHGWCSEVIKGDAGTRLCYWGKSNLKEAIKKAIRSHTYSYYFFNTGYKNAKEKIQNANL